MHNVLTYSPDRGEKKSDCYADTIKFKVCLQYWPQNLRSVETFFFHVFLTLANKTTSRGL